RTARRGVAELGGSVETTAEDRLAIGAEGHRANRAGMWKRLPAGEARGNVPNLGLVVPPRRGQHPSIPPETRVTPTSDVLQGTAEWLPGGGVPKAGTVIVATGHGSPAVGAEPDELEHTLMEQRAANRFARGGVPEPRRAIEAAGQDRLTVGAEGHAQDAFL